MMRKSVYALAVILALGMLPLGSDAFARGHSGGGHFSGGHFGGRSVPHGVSHAVHNSHIGHGLHSGRHGHPTHFVRGHDHHFWHGRWWDYGVGPCWVWSDDYSEYVWVCF
jgi:hypothetical protein